MDASHDSQYGPNLPTKVLSPLLTKSAVDLLINCLTSKVLSDHHLIPYYFLCFTGFSSQLIVPHFCPSSYVVIPSFIVAKNGLFIFYIIKKASHFSRPQPRCHSPNSPFNLFLHCTKEFNACKEKPHSEKIYSVLS